LGKICNQKPSAIFKLSNLKHEANNLLVQPFGVSNQIQTNLNVAMIGISVESIAQIDAMLPASQANANNLNSFTDFVQKMLQNFYNYASSFAKDAPDGQQYVPLITLQNWLDNFKRRFELNPNFWKS
jgi:protein Hikeshi